MILTRRHTLFYWPVTKRSALSVWSLLYSRRPVSIRFTSHFWPRHPQSQKVGRPTTVSPWHPRVWSSVLNYGFCQLVQHGSAFSLFLPGWPSSSAVFLQQPITRCLGWAPQDSSPSGHHSPTPVSPFTSQLSCRQLSDHTTFFFDNCHLNLPNFSVIQQLYPLHIHNRIYSFRY